MREIEFRGKRIDNNEWIYGYLIVDEISDKYYIFSKGNCCNETDKIGEEGVLHILTFEVIPETIGKYTGLKDKNGKKIFEGDIFSLGDKRILYIVEWIDNGFQGRQNGNSSTVGLTYWNSDIEVIGNIYDNPELLKEEL